MQFEVSECFCGRNFKETQMHDMHHMHSMGVDWLSISLSIMFAGGVLFYLYRLFNPEVMRTANGYYDGENEFWHGACLLGMVACLSPAWVPLPSWVFMGTFAVGSYWYLIRALTYGRELSYNKWWYDWAHVAMNFGMFWMFAQPFDHWLVTAAFAAYWAWFGSYYLYRMYTLDRPNPTFLGIGQNFAHLLMAAVMFVMTVWPMAFASHMLHHM